MAVLLSVQWRLCCHSAAIYAVAVLLPQCCYLCSGGSAATVLLSVQCRFSCPSTAICAVAFCCHSAAICAVAVLLPQCCYLCIRACDDADIWTGVVSFVSDLKNLKFQMIIMELLWSNFLRDARRDAHYAAVHCFQSVQTVSCLRPTKQIELLEQSEHCIFEHHVV